MRNFILIISLFLLIACGTRQECLVLNIDLNYKDSVDFNINKYVADSCKIMLYSDSIILDKSEKVYPCNKYIVVARYNRIFLFSRSGEFIKVLAETGRGPGEILFVNNIKIDKNEEYLYCLENNSNKIKVFSLNENGVFHRNINLAKNGIDAFDFMNDSILICFPKLNSSFNNNLLAFTQDLSGNIIKEISLYSPLDNGPVYNGDAIVHKVSDGFLYMPHSKDTLFFINKNLKYKPLLAINSTKDKNTFVNYKVLFPHNTNFILSITENVIENSGDGNLFIIPKGEKFFNIDLEKNTITRVSNKYFTKLSFYKTQNCVLNSDIEDELTKTMLSIYTLI